MGNDLVTDLHALASPEKARVLMRFFKTGKGQYGEGDVFAGVMVPECRKIARRYSHIPLEELEQHLKSHIHEERLIAFLILVEQYKRSSEKEKIIQFYLHNLQRANNWDLVDLTAPKLLGNYLLERNASLLSKLAQSDNLWERRVAIISTLAFIRESKFEHTLKLVELLMHDKHDLIHKACGWALREIGKKNEKCLETFLKMHYKNMPRTMLRYAIEKFDKERRKKYLEGTA